MPEEVALTLTLNAATIIDSEATVTVLIVSLAISDPVSGAANVYVVPDAVNLNVARSFELSLVTTK